MVSFKIIPNKESYWIHLKTNNIYQVIVVTNLEAERQEEYPATVVYRRLKDNTYWSRPLSKWFSSFTLHPAPLKVYEEEMKKK